MRPPLRVLVIGGGLGGLCLAHGLRAAGLDVRVFERQRTQTDPLQSYRIHIDPTGSRALRACVPPPVWQAITEHAARAPRAIQFTTEQLRPLLCLDEDMAGAYPISRAGLRQLLLMGLEDDVVAFEKRLVRFEQTSECVTAHFADGTTASGDVLVGADGVTSAVRRQYLPAAQLHDTGVTGIAGKCFLPRPLRGAWLPPAWLEQMTMVLPPRGLGMFMAPFVRRAPEAEVTAVDLPDHVFWSVIGRPAALGLPRGRLEDGAVLHPLALRAAERWHPLLRRLVAKSDPSTLLSVPLHTAPPVPAWPSTRVTLLGDAIHTMSPLQGLGGNTALRDAALLCQQLAAVQRGEAELLPSIAAYEAAMRGYAFAAVQQSLRVTEQVGSTNTLARLAFKTVLRTAKHVAPVRRRLFAARAAEAAAAV